jgi:hypothetical protein
LRIAVRGYDFRLRIGPVNGKALKEVDGKAHVASTCRCKRATDDHGHINDHIPEKIEYPITMKVIGGLIIQQELMT